MSDILVICPSRGRSSRLAQSIEAARSLQAEPQDYLVVLDSDDEHNYPRIDGVEYLVYPAGTSCVTSCNEIALQRADDYQAMITYADDVQMHTPGWDRLVLDKFAARDGWAIVYGNDGFHHATLATHSFMGTKIVRALGWILLPTLIHLWADHVIMGVGNALGFMEYIPDLLMEHLHHTAGRAPMDDTYRMHWQSEVHSKDHTAFVHWQQTQMQQDIDRVRLAMAMAMEQDR